MAVTYLIRFAVKPDRVPRFLSLLNGVLDAMRAEATFREAILHEDPEDASRFMLYETWEDHEEVLNVQLHRPYRRAYHEALPDLLAEPRDVSMWRPLRADRRE